MNGVIQSFVTCFFHLASCLQGSSVVLACISTSFFLWLYNIPLYVHTTLFTRSSIGGQLDHFHLLAAMNSACKKVHAHVFECLFSIIIPLSSSFVLPLFFFNKIYFRGFPGGAVVENLPASAGDTGLSPGLGRSHMPRSN